MKGHCVRCGKIHLFSADFLLFIMEKKWMKTEFWPWSHEKWQTTLFQNLFEEHLGLVVLEKIQRWHCVFIPNVLQDLGRKASFKNSSLRVPVPTAIKSGRTSVYDWMHSGERLMWISANIPFTSSWWQISLPLRLIRTCFELICTSQLDLLRNFGKFYSLCASWAKLFNVAVPDGEGWAH